MILDTIQMMNATLLVERIPDVEETNSGIVLTDSAIIRNLNFFKVIRVGPKVTVANEGDTVVIGMYSGDDVTLDGNKYKIIVEHNILGIFNGL